MRQVKKLQSWLNLSSNSAQLSLYMKYTHSRMWGVVVCSSLLDYLSDQKYIRESVLVSVHIMLTFYSVRAVIYFAIVAMNCGILLREDSATFVQWVVPDNNKSCSHQYEIVTNARLHIITSQDSITGTYQFVEVRWMVAIEAQVNC